MDLVVMAAGMGSRFGGLKQIEPIDEENNFILDYSIYDAVKAGFGRVLLIIKEENYEIFKNTVGKRLASVVDVEYVFQKGDFLPKGIEVPERAKPWGTAHALYCCKDIIADRFAVISADDFLGYESYKIIADFLKNSNDDEFVSPGYFIDNTISDKGTVKRGIFDTKNGKALRLVESEVKRIGDQIFATPLNQNTWQEISPETQVEMLMFGFSKKIVEKVVEEAEIFFKQPKEKLEKAEFLLPDVVNDMIKNKEASLAVPTTPAKWYGVTYKEDLESFKEAIQDMKQKGIYPKKLYKGREK